MKKRETFINEKKQSLKIIYSNMYNKAYESLSEKLNIPAALALIAWMFIYTYFFKSLKLNGLIYESIGYAGVLFFAYFNVKSIKGYFVGNHITKSSNKDIWTLDKFVIYSFLLVLGSNALISIFISQGMFSSDPQNLLNIHKTLKEVLIFASYTPIVAFSEEIFNIVLVKLFFCFGKKFGKFSIPFAILGASVVFGIVHIISWNIETTILISISFTLYFLVTVFTQNIWYAVIAHFIQDFTNSFVLYSADLNVKVKYYCLLFFIVYLLYFLLRIGFIEIFTKVKSKSNNAEV